GMFIIIQFFIVSCIVMILTVDSLPHKVKVNFVLAFVFFSISFFGEYASIEAYSWNLSNPRVFLTIVKVIEHTCSPLSLFFVTNVASRRGRLHWVFTLPLMTINAVFAVISAFTGWAFSFDENCVYHRGDFYFIFILVIGVIAVAVIEEIVRNSMRFQRRNIPSLVVIIFMFLAGFIVHTINPELYTTFIGGTLAMGMYTLYYMDLNLQLDPVSGLMNRRSYALAIDRIGYPTAIIMMDIDGFKALNDTAGHKYGDECLRAIGDAILQVFSNVGTCYRIGGDEFMVIQTKKLSSIDEHIAKFNERVEEIKEVFTKIQSVSVGYSILKDQYEKDEKLQEADILMYMNKNQKKSEDEN
ncbi:MAG: GGDEF domain-containing protein, partial [Clostridiales bacterium]|nr:GGDEF domain-containing protein [Clostridiales bacterium]